MKYQPSILHPAKTPFKNVEIKAFSDEENLRAFIANRPGLEEMLKEVSSGWRKIIPEGNLELQELREDI